MNPVIAHFERLELLKWFQSLSPEHVAAASVATGLLLPFVLFAIKTSCIWLMRKLGMSAPWGYSRFPLPNLPWRSLVIRPIMVFGRWKEHVFKIGNSASGGFSGVLATLTNTYHNPKKQIPLGLPWIWGFSTYQTIGLEIKTHLLCIGQSGGGKSVWLKTVLACWKQHGSIVAIDPKSEMLRDIFACKRGYSVVALQPYSPDTSGQLNPIDCLDEVFQHGGESIAIQWAYRIAQAFIETPPNSKQPFFTDTARGYMVGLILFVYVTYPKDEQHLGTVRDLIVCGMRVFNPDGREETSREEAFALLHKMMMETTRFSSAIAGAASPFINAGKEALGSLRSTLMERSKILDIPSVRYMLSATTRPLCELKTHRDFALLFCAPVTSIREELKDLVRLVTNLVLYTFEAETKKNGQCLFCIDELNAQGYNGAIEVTLPVARSFGLSVVAAIQDLEGLKSSYPSTYLSFIGNSDATVWLSTSHPMNLTQLSQLLGKRVTQRKDKQTGKKQRVETDVATPDQLGRFLTSDLGNMIATRSGKRPLRLRLDPHHKALPVWMYQADPDHKEALPRRIMRVLLRPFLRKPTAHHSNKPAGSITADQLTSLTDASAVQAETPISDNNIISMQEHQHDR